MGWREEFGPDYAIPAEVVAMVERGELLDCSWHNDVCPSFTLARDGGDVPRLWIEHPDPSEREYNDGSGRYSVTSADDVLYDGDDLTEALAILGAA